MSGAVHHYGCSLAWEGSTADGYKRYERGHRVRFDGVEGALELTADPAFLGDPGRMNPEQLLLAAASSCQLLSFLAVAARARIDVVAYEDRASAVMPEDDPPTRITEIVLRPTITVGGDGASRVGHLVEVAHRQCFIANSLNCAMRIEPTVVEQA